MIPLRQSTAVNVMVGPFLDENDGDTPLTSLIISQSDITLSKNGGSYAQKNESSVANHDSDGEYIVALDAIDTNTLGRLRLKSVVATALPVWENYEVLSQQAYDALYGSGYISAQVKGQDNIDFGALQKASLNAATPASVTGAVGSVTGNVGGNVAGSVASVTAGVTVATNNDKSGYSLSAAYDAAKTAAQPGADGDTLKTLSDQLDAKPTAAQILAQSLGSESYAADGAVPTLAQGLFMLLRWLMGKNVSGTTVTVTRLDDTTTAMTFTTDSATQPTTIERAS